MRVCAHRLRAARIVARAATIVLAVAVLPGPTWMTLAVADTVHSAPALLNQAQDHASLYLRVFGVTPPPYGHVDLCQRDPGECDPGAWEEVRRPGKGAALAELDRVNREVNAEIKPVTDLEQYGVEDYWTIPRSGRGDCEDYALLKRHRLIKAGWPPSSLLMTVVFDERKEGHAVLTARTTDGDLILDNKTSTIKLWNQTPYAYVMRSSYLDPHVWMSLDPQRAVPTVPIPVAGVRSARP